MVFGEVASPGMTKPVPLSVCPHTDFYAGVAVSAGDFWPGILVRNNLFLFWSFFFFYLKLSHFYVNSLSNFQTPKMFYQFDLEGTSFGG